MTYNRLLPLLLIITSCPSYAGMRIDDFSTGGTTVSFNNWSGSGSAVVDVDFCVTSVSGRTRTSSVTVPYEIKLRARGGGNTSVPLQLDATSGSGQTLPLSVTYTDLLAASSEQLQTNVYTAQNKQGGLFQCPTGLNARLRFRINQSDLSTVAAGSYQSLLRIVARGGDGGTERKAKNITVNIVIGDVVQLQGMDDLLLGNYSGNGAISATESFCIYRNGSDAYQVTANGSGSNGSFTLLNNGTEVPYNVEWSDGSSVTPVLANSILTQRQNATADINACNTGSSNASININLLETDLSSSPAGNYRGTLTLMVAPE